MPTTLWLLPSIFAQWIVIFYPGVLVFWLVVHTNIDRLRAVGPRAYWVVAAAAWIATAGPLLLFRRRIFSIRLLMPGLVVAISVVLGAFALLAAVALLWQA